MAGPRYSKLIPLQDPKQICFYDVFSWNVKKQILNSNSQSKVLKCQTWKNTPDIPNFKLKKISLHFKKWYAMNIFCFSFCSEISLHWIYIENGSLLYKIKFWSKLIFNHYLVWLIDSAMKKKKNDFLVAMAIRQFCH